MKTALLTTSEFANYIFRKFPQAIAKTELIRVIRELTNAGYFFEIRNGYNGNGRAFYMVNVLSHKSE